MNKIKELRIQHNIKQKDLAERLNVSQGTLSNWERGIYQPSFEDINALCNIFGVSSDYIIGYVPDDSPPMRLAPNPWNRLIETRLKQGKSIEYLASFAGISVQTYKKYESGTSRPKAEETVDMLAEALGVTSDYLLGYTDDSTYSQKEVLKSFEEAAELMGPLSRIFNLLNSDNRKQVVSYANFLLQEQQKNKS